MTPATTDDWLSSPNERIDPNHRWFPCQHPERPLDSNTSYHVYQCAGCKLAVNAWEHREPDNWKATFMAGMLNDEHWTQ